MSRIFLSTELEGVASWWRIMRRDGVTLGFTTHDRDLMFAGIRHRAAPGMIPSAIRRTAALSDDSAEVEGPLSHDSIKAEDLASGRYDRAWIEIGAVDWETLEHVRLYTGTFGDVSHEDESYRVELRSGKALLAQGHVPQTSPTCRARFCGPGCNLSPARFTTEALATQIDEATNSVAFTGITNTQYAGGEARWLDGPLTGRVMPINNATANGLVFGEALDGAIRTGDRALLREGCNKLLNTCASRFGNAVNFRGEPFVPGNDLLARYPQPQ